MRNNDRQLVKIYKRDTKKGETLYLHYTINGRQVRECTGLRLTGDRINDSATMKAAKMLQAERIGEILSGKAGIKRESLQSKILLTDWCDVVEEQRNKIGKKLHQKQSLKKHFSAFDPKARLCDIDKKFCQKFAEYLAGCGIKQTTANSIYDCFVALLSVAVNDEILEINFASLNKVRPHAKQPERVYLTENEIRAFAAVEIPARLKETRDAFLFSFYTGLRLSDVVRLTATNFETTKDATRLKIETKKTGKFIAFELPTAAAELIGGRLSDAPTFNLKSYPSIEKQLREIGKAAGIDKDFTFHSARHTFATMLLTKGADIYTISTLLGHSKLSTTQIYAKIVDEKKDAAVKLLGGVI